jgi:ferredoxin-NADP reductase
MKLGLISKKQELNDTWTFKFLPLEDINWQPGQSIRLELPRPKWGISERRFTIASAPSEKIIQITTKLSGSEFKQLLSELRPNAEINGFNIEGNFIWENSDKHKLMIAGGIGITPYRSILKARIESKKPCNTTLIYTSSNGYLFEDEFIEWTKVDATLRIVLLNKRLSLDKNSTLLDKWQKSIVYISGSEEMINNLSAQFLNKKVPKSHIKTDIFTGI